MFQDDSRGRCTSTQSWEEKWNASVCVAVKPTDHYEVYLTKYDLHCKTSETLAAILLHSSVETFWWHKYLLLWTQNTHDHILI